MTDKKRDPLFRSVCKEISSSGRYYMTEHETAHADVSVCLHCFHVAQLSDKIADSLHLKCDRRSLICGALLHDYYLYDWHKKDDGSHSWHGFRHNRFALINAMKDYSLNGKERNIIYSHMFPLTPWALPTCREAWIVSIADKICATIESANRK